MLVCHNGDRFRNRRGWLDGSGFVPYKLFGGECSQVFSCRKGLRISTSLIKPIEVPS